MCKLEGIMVSSRTSFFFWILAAAATLFLVGGFEMAQSPDSGGAALRSEQARATNDVPPGMMVVVAEDGKLFHVAGCSFIHDKTRLRTVSARDASQEGYTPCVRCLRKFLRTGLISRPDYAEELAKDSTLK
jgi:hypothetical protein